MLPTPQTPRNPPTRLHRAFTRMAWVGWSFEAALQNPTRRAVLVAAANKRTSQNNTKTNKHGRS